MDFAFTPDQLALAETVRDVLTEHCPASALRSERLPAWDRLAAVGFFGLLVPPEADGLGLCLVDALPALEETGRACLPGPVVETAVVAPYLLPGVPKLASGAVRVSVVPPGGAGAPDADLADLIVVAAPSTRGRDGGAVVVGREAARLRPLPGPDPCRRLSEVTYTESTPLDRPLAPALRAATVATAAQLIGVARRLLEVSVAYARSRRQFGAPIGSFQAVKHRLADVAVAVAFAAPLVHRAALAVEAAVPDAGLEVRAVPDVGRDVSAAKAAAGEAADLAARAALQTHGAIGYTEELDLRFWLARAWSLSAAYGGAAEHRARIREALAGGDLRRYP
ncbi:acyl-CoA/acyl-ACP dehydrogenase [Nonomuraea rhodomycinica]|uniref:Acyl-CoA/acyl-ACP dehydrogenase n=2 Tax=Nonomuraea rhodomycinica TaxID=1712872 RepID=A0A7Y6ILR9_9ACTN|nr:acyl-CoA/acyl-ACP dehydrogenase [Nonomuraea rhodomycinica]